MHIITERVLSLSKKHRIGIICFAFLTLYGWLIASNGMLPSVNQIVYSNYALDYSLGFCSRMLIGSTYRALIGVYSFSHVNCFVAAFLFLLFGIVSFFMERFYAAAPVREKKNCLLLMFLFLSGPFTFSVFVKQFGILDMYWVLFFAIALLLISNKYLKWTLPILFVLMILTHLAAFFCYAALLLCMLLFFAAKTDNVSERRQYYVIFAVSFVITVGLVAFFVQNDNKTAVYPMETFNEILRNRNVTALEYCDAEIYGVMEGQYFTELDSIKNMELDPSSTGIIYFLKRILLFVGCAQVLRGDYTLLWFPALMELPVAALLLHIMVSYFRARKGQKEKRFSALLMILLFFGTTVTGLILSSDTFRWMSHAVIGLFISVFSVLYFDYREGIQKIRLMIGKVGLPVTAVYALVYAVTIIDPYIV